MSLIKKAIGGFVIIGSLMMLLREHFIVFAGICFGLFVLVIIIRLLADLFWWGRDNDKW